MPAFNPMRLLEPLVPFVLALVVGAIVLLAAGHNPITVYALMVEESVGGERRIAAALSAATPILLTGLATAVAFRAGVFNVGIEGCFYLGGLVAAVVGYAVGGLPAAIHILLVLLAAGLVGAVWMGVPGVLKAKLDVDEVVTTLMLNFIAIGITAYLVNGPLFAPGSANSATRPILASAELPRLLPPSTLNLGFVIACLMLIGYALWNRFAPLGFEARLTGLNPLFSRAVGINVPAVVIKVMLISGAIGALAGALHTLGIVHRFVAGFSPGYGFTGIAVALLGRNSAIGILLAGLVFGALASSGATIQLFSDVPIEIVQILQGTVMVFAVAKLGLLWARRRRARS
jgi:simple sugar transport system permease protein